MITDLLSPAAVHDPHAVYRALRERAPLTWLPEHRAWFVAGYAGVHEAFRDPRLSSDRLTPLERRLDDRDREVLGDTFELLRGWMVFHDPPAHERLRGPLRRAFTPKTVEALRPHVVDTVRVHLDTMEDRLRAGEALDLIDALAFPLPAIVIAELLGVPPSDRDDFKTWSDQLAAIVFGASDRESKAERAAAGTAQFVAYFAELIAHYENHPADNLITALLAAARDADPPLTAAELIGACTLLLFGGHETTTNLLANSVVTLLDDPARRDWLVAHPGATATAAEELHRFDGSSKVMVRIAATTHHRDGVEVEEGATFFLGIASANRDPAMFDRPDEVRLDRVEAQRHLGYGYGPHFCLGAPLARLETTIALQLLFERFPHLELATPAGELSYGATILGRGPVAVPLCLAPG